MTEEIPERVAWTVIALAVLTATVAAHSNGVLV